jgi:hypothetical protein
MKLAITCWQKRVAPVFDVAQTAMIISKNQTDSSPLLLNLAIFSPFDKINRLMEVNVNELICGAISRPVFNYALRMGLNVYAFVAGDISQIIQAWMNGEWNEGQFMMPGCQGNGCCRQQRRRKFGRGWQADNKRNFNK